MTTVFDASRALAKALRESDEAKKLARAGAKVRKEQRLERLLREFRRAQLDIQTAGVAGKSPGKEQVERFQKLAKQAEGEALLVEYLTAENAYGNLLVEVQEILAEAFSPDLPGALDAPR
ncbi:MAG TPA: YlbF family regulator [Symbiobacteriaceae bacterium]|nr:YlbF family regulator [Symbiobacteriaceae bacterium]